MNKDIPALTMEGIPVLNICAIYCAGTQYLVRACTNAPYFLYKPVINEHGQVVEFNVNFH